VSILKERAMRLYALRSAALGVLGLMLGTAGPAWAGGLLYDSVDAQYLVPTISTVNEALGVQTVDPTASWVFSETVFITATNSTIQLYVPPDRAIGFSSLPFAGFGFTDLTNNPDITGVTIDPSSTVPGFDLSRVTFTSDQVFLNFSTLGIGSGQQVLLDLNFASNTVPEPSSLALTGIAVLVGFFAWSIRGHYSATKASTASEFAPWLIVAGERSRSTRGGVRRTFIPTRA
jgi:hypothetical protein